MREGYVGVGEFVRVGEGVVELARVEVEEVQHQLFGVGFQRTQHCVVKQVPRRLQSSCSWKARSLLFTPYDCTPKHLHPAPTANSSQFAIASYANA